MTEKHAQIVDKARKELHIFGRLGARTAQVLIDLVTRLEKERDEAQYQLEMCEDLNLDMRYSG